MSRAAGGRARIERIFEALAAAYPGRVAGGPAAAVPAAAPAAGNGPASDRTCEGREGREGPARAASPPLNWSPDPFRELISTILSQRTLDANTDRAAARLFALADSASAIAALDEARLAEAIRPANFYRTKARTIRACCRVLLERFGGTVPRGMADLLALPGVGRKTANCVRYFAFGEPALVIDTHAHRVANRLGLVRTASPDDTEARLSPRLPPERWGPFTDLLVEHGKRVCRPIGPRCDACAVRAFCRRVGVARRSVAARDRRPPREPGACGPSRGGCGGPSPGAASSRGSRKEAGPRRQPAPGGRARRANRARGA